MSLNAGGVSINDGASIASSKVSLPWSAGTIQILPADPIRKCAIIQVAPDDSVWLGDATITWANKKGIKASPNDVVTYRNTAALYACADLDDTSITIMVEK
mgnify:CR=1 FL=1